MTTTNTRTVIYSTTIIFLNIIHSLRRHCRFSAARLNNERRNTTGGIFVLWSPISPSPPLSDRRRRRRRRRIISVVFSSAAYRGIYRAIGYKTAAAAAVVRNETSCASVHVIITNGLRLSDSLSLSFSTLVVYVIVTIVYGIVKRIKNKLYNHPCDEDDRYTPAPSSRTDYSVVFLVSKV